jgi:hypothetical protein
MRSGREAVSGRNVLSTEKAMSSTFDPQPEHSKDWCRSRIGLRNVSGCQDNGTGALRLADDFPVEWTPMPRPANAIGIRLTLSLIGRSFWRSADLDG